MDLRGDARVCLFTSAPKKYLNKCCGCVFMAERYLFSKPPGGGGNFRNVAIAIFVFLALLIFIFAYSRVLGG